MCQNFYWRSTWCLCSQIFKKAAAVKRRRQMVALLGCGWRHTLGMKGRRPEQTQPWRDRGSWGAHQSRDTVEGLCPTVNPCWGGGTQGRSKKQQTPPQSLALPLTSLKGLGVSECNLANSRWVETFKKGEVFYWIRAQGRKVFLCQRFCLIFFFLLNTQISNQKFC